ncbi:MAG: VCBS repeat-containing protein [Planctomycetota bacterium]
MSRSRKTLLTGLLTVSICGGAALRAQDWLKVPLLLDDVPGILRLAGDVDGDGDIDLIRFNGASFTVLLNDGHSVFTNGPSYVTADSPNYVLFADVDGDGDGEVIASTLTTAAPGAGLSIFFGSTGATFGAPVHVALGGNVTSLTSGNVDGNGLADIAVVHFAPGSSTSMVRWIPGAANRSLVPNAALTLPAASFVSDLNALDANGDGIDDLAYVDGAISPVSLVLRFTVAGVPTANGPTFAQPSNYGTDLIRTDIDGDGDQDLLLHAYLAFSPTTLRTYTNAGNGSWTAGAPTSLGGIVAGRSFVCDWDGDGDQDLVLRESETGSSTTTYHSCDVYENFGANSGTFVRRFAFSVFGASEYLGGVGVFELNGDGHPDFVDSRSVFCGDGSWLAPAVSGVFRGYLEDWEGDGDLDVPSYEGEVFTNDGRGVLISVRNAWPTPSSPNLRFGTDVFVTDLDGDGLHDAIAPMFQVVFVSMTFLEMRRFEDDGAGHFVDLGSAAPPGVRIDGDGIVDDVDGDGDLDFVNMQGIWLNNGAGFFTSAGPSPFPSWLPIGKGDVDGDGDQDLLATPLGGAGAALLRRTGPATYNLEILSPIVGQVVGDASAVLADLDGDGDLDIACKVSPYSTDFRIFANQGGVFSAAATLPIGAAGRLLASDVDFDGRSDLVLSDGQRITVRRRNSAGFVYDAPVAFGGPYIAAFADMDQDGDLDGIPTRVMNRHFDGDLAGRRRQYGLASAGSGGHKPLLGVEGILRSGSTPVLHLRQAVGGAPAALVVGAAQANLPDFGVPGLTLYASPILLTQGLTLGGTVGTAGAGRFDLPLTLPPGHTGLKLYFQVVVLDAGAAYGYGVAVSNGLEFVIGQ